MERAHARRCAAGLLAATAVAAALGQWDPPTGRWGKTDPTDIRLMTYNIRDGISTVVSKTEANNNWHALARLVAAFRPDVLFLQEAGDTGTGANSTVDLGVVLDLFLHGGTDIYAFPPAEVTAYVQKYAPCYDLPHVYVSTYTDGFNRNVILSRFPFADLNGDGQATRARLHIVLPDPQVPWSVGGNDGIRGGTNAEIDLPDGVYAGDMVAVNYHLKSGSDATSKNDRIAAAKVGAYYFHYLYNGAGTGVPDPHNVIADSPAVTQILDDDTFLVIGGDWNEDELSNGRRGPAEWLTRAELDGAFDGVDRDQTDMLFDESVDPKNLSRGTFGDGSSKIDYIGWQDSIVTLRRSFVFKSLWLAGTPSWYPPEIVDFPSPQNPVPYNICATASDHRPLIADFVAPRAPGGCPGDVNCDGVVNFADIDPFVAALGAPCGDGWPNLSCPWFTADADGDGGVDFSDIDPFVARIGTVCP